MINGWMKVLTVILAGAILLTMPSLIACCASVESRYNLFTVGSSPELEVSVGNGDVVLKVHAGNELTISAELHKPGDVDFQVSQNGDLVTLDAKCKSGSRANVTVTVPENTQFTLSTGNGSVEASDVQASGKINSGNGSITIRGTKGDIDAIVGNGSITLSDVAGSFKLIAGNGDVAFKGELTSGGDNTVNVGNGATVMELTGSPSVALDLETDDGEVKCELAVTASEQSKDRLVGTVGNGDATLSVQTGSGDITIK